MVQAIERQVVDFEMPGGGIPDFAEHAAAIARAGIYDLAIHHDQILVPVVLRHWGVEQLDRPRRRRRAGPRPADGPHGQERARVARRIAERRAAEPMTAGVG